MYLYALRRFMAPPFEEDPMLSRSFAASYAVVLRPPHAARTFGMALVGRSSYGVVFLSLVLAVARITGSYATAGVVIALFGLASSLLSPFRARLIDRYGPRTVLPPMAVLYALLLAAMAAVTWQSGAPRVLLWILAAACGACTPPLGPLMRTLWAVMIPDRDLLQRAYSLDTVAEELLFVTGPLVAGLFAAYANPALGVAVSAGLLLTGSLALASSPIVRNQVYREKEHSRPGGASCSVADLDLKARQHASFRAGSGLRHSVLVSAGMGMCLGALGILCVAFTGRHHHMAAVAWVEAALAVSSAVGGLAYGAFRWRASGQTRLVVLASGIGLSVALAGQSPGIYILVAAIAVVGLFVSPTLITAYLVAEEGAAPGTRTEGGTWVNTAHNLGNSAGTAGIGLLVDRFALPACFAAAALTALLPAIAVAIGKRKRPAVVTAPEQGDEMDLR